MAAKFIRSPAVAGVFYPSTESELRQRIEWCLKHDLGPGRVPAIRPEGGKRVLGLVSPHAGYIYSGPVAAHGFASIANTPWYDTVVIVGPNHHGLGAKVAIGGCAAWATPLGEVRLDQEVANRIVAAFPEAQIDDAAHALEHSIEVQLPFLQFVLGCSFRLVPIVMLVHDSITAVSLGQAIAGAVRDRQALVVASTDLTHYELSDIAKKKDARAIDVILRLAAADLFQIVRTEKITMCGPGPVTATITACVEAGAIAARLLRYATSAEVSGENGPAVGYASIAITD